MDKQSATSSNASYVRSGSKLGHVDPDPVLFRFILSSGHCQAAPACRKTAKAASPVFASI
jgi:hypothetical protein